jgi:hypothetical protein
VIRRASATIGKVKAAFTTHEPNDVLLNQPGRALVRCILWTTTAAAFAAFPLGHVALQVARVDALNYVFANLAGLLLSGLLSQVMLLIVLTIVMVAFPLLGASRVPRPPVEPRPEL